MTNGYFDKQPRDVDLIILEQEAFAVWMFSEMGKSPDEIQEVLICFSKEEIISWIRGWLLKESASRYPASLHTHEERIREVLDAKGVEYNKEIGITDPNDDDGPIPVFQKLLAEEGSRLERKA